MKLLLGKINCWSFLINKDYGFELSLINKIRNFKDGISFFRFDVNWDRYIGDHTPCFEMNLLLLNWIIFELNIYNINHINETEESMEYKVKTHKGAVLKVKDVIYMDALLLKDATENGCFIREYLDKKKEKYNDYEIQHSDLKIFINENEAAVYEDSDGNKWIDHLPATLGYRNLEV